METVEKVKKALQRIVETAWGGECYSVTDGCGKLKVGMLYLLCCLVKMIGRSDKLALNGVQRVLVETRKFGWPGLRGLLHRTCSRQPEVECGNLSKVFGRETVVLIEGHTHGVLEVCLQQPRKLCHPCTPLGCGAFLAEAPAQDLMMKNMWEEGSWRAHLRMVRPCVNLLTPLQPKICSLLRPLRIPQSRILSTCTDHGLPSAWLYMIWWRWDEPGMSDMCRKKVFPALHICTSLYVRQFLQLGSSKRSVYVHGQRLKGSHLIGNPLLPVACPLVLPSCPYLNLLAMATGGGGGVERCTHPDFWKNQGPRNALAPWGGGGGFAQGPGGWLC